MRLGKFGHVREACTQSKDHVSTQPEVPRMDELRRWPKRKPNLRHFKP